MWSTNKTPAYLVTSLGTSRRQVDEDFQGFVDRAAPLEFKEQLGDGRARGRAASAKG